MAHLTKRSLILASVLLVLAGTNAIAQKPDFKVLAFYSTNVERDHVEFSNDLRAHFSDLCDKLNFTFDVTKDWTNLNDTLLKNYQVVMWINDFPHTAQQRQAFQRYMENGGGWIGFHVAGYNDKTTRWPWFVDFMGGAVFFTNSWPPLAARLILEDPSHPVTKDMPPAITSPVNEWYQWKPSPRENKNVKVLATLDPSNYPLGIKDILTGGDTPVMWTNTRYNMIYLNMGHGDLVMSDYVQNKMITNALMWVGKSARTTPTTKVARESLPEMIHVRGGTFRMGDENGDKDEQPAHEVTVADFHMAKTETTIGQWRAFCHATNRTMPEEPWFPQTDEHPVVNVSYDHAVAYCLWLTEQTGTRYRLPTEAEWEYVAAGGLQSKRSPYSGATNPDSVAWIARQERRYNAGCHQVGQ